MVDPALPITATLTFGVSLAGATVQWEADPLGVRHSVFAPPYQGADLALVISALDVLQYPNYPLHATEWQRQRFTFSMAEQERLHVFGLWRDEGRVRADAHQLVGRALYQALAADAEGARVIDTLRNYAAANGQPLALRLRFPPSAVELAALPWELLWDAGPVPLLLSRGRLASCTRHLDLPQALPPARPHHQPIQVLAIAPESDIPADVREEERAARRTAWQPLIDSGQLIVREVSPATRRALVDAVQQSPKPDIVHYYGHGRYKGGEGALLLDAAGGGRDWTSASTLMALLGDVRLVALFACQGAMVAPGELGLLSGVAPALSAAGVPLVIGMQLTTRVEAAIRASGIIYHALVAGESVQDAVSQARQALFVEEPDRASWYLPALYIRSRETGPAYLTAPAAAPPIAATGSTQSIIARKKSKVSDVQMHGSAGSVQRVVADDRSSVERAELNASQASKQEILAEEESEAADIELDDRKPLAPDQ
ncbi:MAG: CHAT domain-containing protein [Chloroflexota bacterium]|nr:CHAT domain-containing protein [Chloroflexota bacterium]